MSQIFTEEGLAIPVTIIEAGPVTVIELKDHNGKKAVQVGYGVKKEKRVTKAERGRTKDMGNFAHFKEFVLGEGQTFEVGTVLDAGVFALGDVVTVSATSKGKGFQGVVKRHGFAGGPRTHGQKHSEREPGSIGGGGRAGGRVAKGMRMAGRMGGDRITVKSLKVVHIDADKKLLYVKGAIPGRRGTVVEIKG